MMSAAGLSPERPSVAGQSVNYLLNRRLCPSSRAKSLRLAHYLDFYSLLSRPDVFLLFPTDTLSLSRGPRGTHIKTFRFRLKRKKKQSRMFKEFIQKGFNH
ncbi:hypothetical protein Q8A67_021881 [Cirrhinus molitorella]|uniref:Uncharacterized protein n=1 Tax=Cirrhinus molitorella TaxID=172907 RepID=A0AA88P6K1_9TELE|nr:hypothetical protein Q8A67_021881 [Cirrhinus molitorella]